MEKNEVYDYLARVYFDKKTGKKKKQVLKFRYLLFLIPVIFIGIIAYVFFGYSVKEFTPKKHSLYLATGNELIKISFNFSGPSLRKEGYVFSLNNLNASKFKNFNFESRHLASKNLIRLRIEVESSFKEIATAYISGITDKWHEYSISLDEFKGITSWVSLSKISFIVEEWNTDKKDDIVYIDNVRFTSAK